MTVDLSIHSREQNVIMTRERLNAHCVLFTIKSDDTSVTFFMDNDAQIIWEPIEIQNKE